LLLAYTSIFARKNDKHSQAFVCRREKKEQEEDDTEKEKKKKKKKNGTIHAIREISSTQ
jgi:hypothetical protein